MIYGLMSKKNNNPRGILFILLAMMIFSIQDGIMKHIYNFVSLYEVYLIRTLVSFTLIIIFLKLTKKPIVFKSQYPLLTLCRVILFFFGFSSFYVSLTVLPLGTATALFFVTPFLITIFAYLFLKEQIGPRRWLAVVVGFIGVYITLDPDFSDFNYLSLLPILCAFCYSLSMIIIKKPSDKDSVYTKTFTFYLGMVATGFTATGAFLLLFTAYSIASPSVVSPFEYSILLWSPLVGWLYFGEIPTTSTIIGILIIVSSGVYIFMREKAQDQLIATEKPLR